MLRPCRNERFRSSPKEGEVGFETAHRFLSLRTFSSDLCRDPSGGPRRHSALTDSRSAQTYMVAALVLRPFRNERFRSSPKEGEVGFETAHRFLSLRTFSSDLCRDPSGGPRRHSALTDSRSAQTYMVAALERRFVSVVSCSKCKQSTRKTHHRRGSERFSAAHCGKLIDALASRPCRSSFSRCRR